MATSISTSLRVQISNPYHKNQPLSVNIPSEFVSINSNPIRYVLYIHFFLLIGIFLVKTNYGTLLQPPWFST